MTRPVGGRRVDLLRSTGLWHSLNPLPQGHIAARAIPHTHGSAENTSLVATPFPLQSGLSRQTREAEMSRHWQLQEAKQRFSELIRSVEVDGPQFVTRHGAEVAVVIDIAEYRRLKGDSGMDFKDFLLSGPRVDDLEIHRSSEPTRDVDLGEVW
jgi:prevent-host-death family protein